MRNPKVVRNQHFFYNKKSSGLRISDFLGPRLSLVIPGHIRLKNWKVTNGKLLETFKNIEKFG